MKTPICRACGGKVLYGNLYCSKECGQQHSAERLVPELEAQGFVRDENTPNIFRKNGIAITLEATRHVGLETALRQHEHAQSQRA